MEQPLLPFMACNLSSINVHKFCKDNGEYDYEALYSVAYTVTRLMDNLIDVMDFPDERFKINVLKYRPIGVGLMGLSDALYEMGLPYDSKEGQLFAGKIMKTLTTACIDCSADLANEKGAFDSYDVVKDDVYEVVSSLIDDPDVLEKVKKYGLRNCQHTTVAPTGCLKDGTLVSSSYGVRRIEEFGKILNETNRGPITKSDFGPVHIEKYFDQGYSNTIKITTSKGYSLEGTVEHKLRVLSQGNGYKWVRIGDIKNGDLVVLKKNFIVDDKNNKSKLLDNNSIFELLGFYMADGWWANADRSKNGVLAFSVPDTQVDYITSLMSKAFGDMKLNTHKIRKEEGTSYCKVVYNTTELYNWFKENKCIKDGAVNAFVPDIVMKGSRQNMLSFIKGYLEGDGFVRKNTDGRIGFKTISANMATKLHTILLGLGYISRLSVDKVVDGQTIEICGRTVNKNYDVYNVLVTSYYSSLLYKELYGEINNVKSNCNELVILTPNEQGMFSYLKDIGNENYCTSYKSYIETIDENNYNWFVKNDLMFDVVSNIEYFSDVHVNDLEVLEKSHTYVANGFITHNSIALSCDCSYGMEPCFGLVFSKKLVETGDVYNIINPIFKRKYENESWYSTDIIDKIIQNGGSLKGIRGIPKEVRDVFVVAHDIKPKDRIDMQATLQAHCSTSISSCVVEDTLIETDNGLFYIDELIDFSTIPSKTFKDNTSCNHSVLDHNMNYSKISSFYNNGESSVFALTLTNGMSIECTGNEKFILLNDEDGSETWMELSMLSSGDRIKVRDSGFK